MASRDATPPAQAGTRLEAAVECYAEILRLRHVEETQAALDRLTRAQNLVWLGRPLCTVLRPCFVETFVLRRALRASRQVLRGLNAVSRELLRNAELRREIDISDADEEAIRADPASVGEIVGRLDGFIGPEGLLRVIEFNPDPGAVASYYRLSRFFAELPAMREFSRRFVVRNATTWGSLVWVLASMVGRLLARRGLTVIWSGAPQDEGLSDQLEVEVEAAARIMRRLSLRMDVVRPEALSFGADSVFHAERRVAFAYVTDWPGLLRAFPFGHPFWRALSSRRLAVVNSWGSTVLRANKGVFALFGDQRCQRLFEPAVRAALGTHVPWTRRVHEAWSEWRGTRIDLPSFIQSRRERLVLKPASARGGKGVVLGWTSTEAQWTEALERALREPYVVQERVEARHERFPTLRSGQLEVRDYATDFNAFAWMSGTVRGCMARVSEGPLMNVTAGAGSLAPVFSIRL